MEAKKGLTIIISDESAAQCVEVERDWGSWCVI